MQGCALIVVGLFDSFCLYSQIDSCLVTILCRISRGGGMFYIRSWIDVDDLYVIAVFQLDQAKRRD